MACFRCVATRLFSVVLISLCFGLFPLCCVVVLTSLCYGLFPLRCDSFLLCCANFVVLWLVSVALRLFSVVLC